MNATTKLVDPKLRPPAGFSRTGGVTDNETQGLSPEVRFCNALKGMYGVSLIWINECVERRVEADSVEKLAQVAMTAVQQLGESVDLRCPALGYRSIGGVETNAAGLKAAYVIVNPVGP